MGGPIVNCDTGCGLDRVEGWTQSGLAGVYYRKYVIFRVSREPGLLCLLVE